jgi:hypothetical protein
VSQVAAVLGLDAPEIGDSTLLAWATLPPLRAWLDRVRALEPGLLTQPTQSRGRTLRNLTVNVFHPFELLPAAWTSGQFPWEPERDDERERALGDVVSHADGILATWTAFVLEHAEVLGRRDPVVSSPRGEVRFSAVLDSQRNHAAFHLDELVVFLSERE